MDQFGCLVSHNWGDANRADFQKRNGRRVPIRSRLRGLSAARQTEALLKRGSESSLISGDKQPLGFR